MITGYDVRPSMVETGDSVDVTVYLYRTDGQKSDIRIIRGVDSFQRQHREPLLQADRTPILILSN